VTDAPASRLGDHDDQPHQLSEDPWETETWWFSFVVPERAMLGYLYTFVRPNLGICGGGAMVWDDTGHLPWDALFFDHQWSIPLPRLPEGPRLVFPNGTTVEVRRALHDYHVEYRSIGHRSIDHPGDQGLSVDIDFEGVTEPNAFVQGRYPFVVAAHLDQPGRVRGVVVVRGERVAIDCFAMRDRSWGGPRTDLKATRVGYSFGTAAADRGFLAFARPHRDGSSEPEPVTSGYLLRDGIRAPLVEGGRRVVRDEAQGWPTRIELWATDADGRHLAVVGHAVNRIAFQAYPRMLNWTSLMRWEDDGAVAWGEDQDVWPLGMWRRPAAR